MTTCFYGDGRRVDHHVFRLVDHQQHIILVEDPDRDILRHKQGRLEGRDLAFDLDVFPHFERGFRNLFLHADMTLLINLLTSDLGKDSTSGDIRHFYVVNVCAKAEIIVHP